MSKAQAKEFIEKLFNDDAFLEETIRKNGGLPDNKDADKSRNYFAEMGEKMGYDFTLEEYDEATKEVFENQGFKGLKKMFRMIRVASKVSKKMKKGK